MTHGDGNGWAGAPFERLAAAERRTRPVQAEQVASEFALFAIVVLGTPVSALSSPPPM